MPEDPEVMPWLCPVRPEVSPEPECDEWVVPDPPRIGVPAMHHRNNQTCRLYMTSCLLLHAQAMSAVH